MSLTVFGDDAILVSIYEDVDRNPERQLRNRGNGSIPRKKLLGEPMLSLGKDAVYLA